jgi:hypothetical protein
MARKYQRRSARDWAEKQERALSFATSVQLPKGLQFFKPERDLHRLDFMMYLAGEGHPVVEPGEPYWERSFWTHRVPTVDGRTDRYICPYKTLRRACPICEQRAELSREPGNEEEVKSLKASLRQLWLVKDLDDEDYDGFKIWDVSQWHFGNLLKEVLDSADEDEDYDLFADPEEGLTMKIKFGPPSAQYANYREPTVISFKKRTKQYKEDIIEEAPCLDDMLIIKDYNELKATFLGLEEQIENEEVEEPTRRRSREVVDEDETESRPRRRRRVVDEDEEEEPRQRRRRRVPDDEDDFDN